MLTLEWFSAWSRCKIGLLVPWPKEGWNLLFANWGQTACPMWLRHDWNIDRGSCLWSFCSPSTPIEMLYGSLHGQGSPMTCWLHLQLPCFAEDQLLSCLQSCVYQPITQHSVPGHPPQKHRQQKNLLRVCSFPSCGMWVGSAQVKLDCIWDAAAWLILLMLLGWFASLLM